MGLHGLFLTVTAVLLAVALVATTGVGLVARQSVVRREDLFFATGLFATAAVMSVVALITFG